MEEAETRIRSMRMEFEAKEAQRLAVRGGITARCGDSFCAAAM
jgi:hypothetical protein